MSLAVDGRPIAGRWDFVFLRDGAPLGDASSDVGLGMTISALINMVHDPQERFFREDPAFLKAAGNLLHTAGWSDEGGGLLRVRKNIGS